MQEQTAPTGSEEQAGATSSLRPNLEPSDRARFEQTAMELARGVVETALKVKDGSLTWKGLRLNGRTGQYEIALVGPQLYGGGSGIAAGLAAFYNLTSEEVFRETALKALIPLRKALAKAAADPENASAGLQVGGLSGLGGFVYCFLRAGLWLDEPELVDEAHGLTRLFTQDRYGRDRVYDLMAGSSGGLLALLTLDRYRPEKNASGFTPLDAARGLGDHLIEQRISIEDGPRAWETRPGSPPLTGFSHGAAGAAYALMALYGRTGDERYREAAHEGIEYERLHFVPEYRNWRDLRTEQMKFGVSWCHGAPGIALGRMASYELHQDSEYLEEARMGLSRVQTLPMSSLDHLCCGNIGRAAILMEGYRFLGEQEWHDSAVKLANDTLDRADEQGGFAWQQGKHDGPLSPSLLTGATGVAYVLKQWTEPEALPSLLLLD